MAHGFSNQLLLIPTFFLILIVSCCALSGTPLSFSLPIVLPTTSSGPVFPSFRELWDDPRPVSSLVTDKIAPNEIPYCILSDTLHLPDVSGAFRILVYPKGRLGRSRGSASAYLSFEPLEKGDEADVLWTLRLVDGQTNTTAPVVDSGGLPRSERSWSSGMTFVHESEAVDTCGRCRDWGSSVWAERDVLPALERGDLRAEGTVNICGARRGDTSLPKGRGALGAAARAIRGGDGRLFRVGEVVVPARAPAGATGADFLRAGVDYRIMTATDGDGRPIFSTADVPPDRRSEARLALRPCGTARGTGTWPAEVEVSVLAACGARSRLDIRALPGRTVAQIVRDGAGLAFAVLIALSPVPAVLLARNFVGVYIIPTASMEPTLHKGDVLLVEKMPGALGRARRGDVVMFRPSRELLNIIGPKAIKPNDLFVKRLVGLPGDSNIVLDKATGDVSIGGKIAAGPRRDICEDEPLRLIDAFLENGKGALIEQLGADEAYVLGDCKAVSVDSRVFGTLPRSNVVGKPIGRIWPPDRIDFGAL